MRFRLLCSAVATAAVALTLVSCTGQPPADQFYSYSGPTPLASLAPGTILKTRTISYHIVGIPTSVRVIQLLYRSTDVQGRPTANVTSILKPAKPDPSKAVSYQSFYDSLNPADSPSRSIAGDVTRGGLVNNVEAGLIQPLLAKGYTVLVPDTEGQNAAFAAGPEYGYNTLDSIRAALRSPASGIDDSTRIGLLGYSGGAIATSWAAALAPGYAPDVNKHLVGFAEGGVLVNPAHNLLYVSGSYAWAGVAGMAIVGISRSFDVDLSPYVSDLGKRLLPRFDKVSIIDVILRYPGVRWEQLVKPEYANPNSIPEYVEAVNRINLGLAPTPSIPGFIEQGAGGVLEGTPANKPGIGPGDGVMVAGDVRALARQYCETGNRSISYVEDAQLSHVMVGAKFVPAAMKWIDDRLAGKPAPSSCGTISAGNSLAAQRLVAPGK